MVLDLSFECCLHVPSTGHPEYGCFISRDKTLTNFDYDSQIMNVTSPLQRGMFFAGDANSSVLIDIPDFPWCGYLINMKDLSVMSDYSRFHDNCARLLEHRVNFSTDIEL
jgi:telomerase reverse transcriptase